MAAFEPITPERLAEIRERCENATPGPWGVGNETTIGLGVEQLSSGRFRCAATIAEVTDELDREDFAAENGVEVAHAEDDAFFIAHARQDVEDLLAEVDRLLTRVDHLKAEFAVQAAEMGDLLDELAAHKAVNG